MRRGILAALPAALAVGTGLLVVSVASGGGDAGPLRWSGPVVSFTHPTLPTDHIVSGRLRDTSMRPMRVVARRDIRVVDVHGRDLPASAVFTQTFGHGLFDPTRLPEARLPERELMRIGDVGRFQPGDELPVTVSWRDEHGSAPAARIAYPGGSLAIPEESAG
ncbi:hypothetical protein [Capillimicrobium parvum]|uniref:Uncharacterized protein n=1 Tax=Capillimicrobium parvum TaxID=2884022 RepID=A0A9E6XSZ6_9ACTN|nr:hypothetical protein [Capillimicrobium parvum]UGS34052.1 hypothetical protein DSM104329_00423 [Capillimicrobium parvum]